MSNPDQIQRDIERTRSELSTDVDRLSEKVSPSKVVGRRVDRLRGRASSVKDRVMGSSPSGTGLRGSGDSISSAASTVGDAVSGVPQQVRQQTQGNPLAAGVIAFGVGWLLASLAPPADVEQRLAEQAEAKAKDLAEPVKQTGQQMAEDMKQPVQESIEQVKSTATDAAQDTVDQTRSAADDVKQPLHQ
jgi:hypothetical protein